MTSAHAEPPDWAAAAAEVAPGHPVTVRPDGRPALRLVSPVDWAAGELARLFLAYAPAGVVDPSRELATGREPADVYSRAFQDAGLPFGDAEKRAIALTRAVDRVLEDLYDALGKGAGLVAVVPQLRGDLVAAGRVERVTALHDAGLGPEWIGAAADEPDWLLKHPAGGR